MGCHWITDKEVGRVFIPGCMGAAAMGIDNCTCYKYRGRRLTPTEMIDQLKKENKELKERLKQYESN